MGWKNAVAQLLFVCRRPIAWFIALSTFQGKPARLRHSAEWRETTYCLFLKLQSRFDGGRSSAPILPPAVANLLHGSAIQQGSLRRFSCRENYPYHFSEKWCGEKHPCQKWCGRLTVKTGLFLPLIKMVQRDLWVKPRSTKNEHKKAGHPCYSQGCPMSLRRYAISIDDVLMWWSQQDPNLCPHRCERCALSMGPDEPTIDEGCRWSLLTCFGCWNMDCLTCVAVRSAAAQTVHFWKSPDRPCICEYRYERLCVGFQAKKLVSDGLCISQIQKVTKTKNGNGAIDYFV